MTSDHRNTRTQRAILGGILLAGALFAAPAAFAEGHDYTVTVNSQDYVGIPSKLKVGDTITWVNRDTVQHSITARDHSFDIRLTPGQTAKQTMDKPGKIPIYCLFHPTMRGTLNVVAK